MVAPSSSTSSIPARRRIRDTGSSAVELGELAVRRGGELAVVELGGEHASFIAAGPR